MAEPIPSLCAAAGVEAAEAGLEVRAEEPVPPVPELEVPLAGQHLYWAMGQLCSQHPEVQVVVGVVATAEEQIVLPQQVGQTALVIMAGLEVKDAIQQVRQVVEMEEAELETRHMVLVETAQYRLFRVKV